MPFPWRKPRYYYWRRKQPYNRYRKFRRRRFRKTLRGRRYRRYRVRRYRRYKHKLKKVTLKVWQPSKIVKCKIKGDLALFICGQTRTPHNFTLYKESTSPVGEAAGGAWSIQQITLDALYSEFIKYRNFWTKGNQGLPLTRYTGATLKFYRSPHTDYIVTISTCPPFSVTKDMYFNTQPQRQLFEKRKILVTQLISTTKRKFKKVKIKPPALMSTKWFFQQDICKIPLVRITCTACSFQQPYCPENQISNNITIYTLNTEMFQNPDYTTNPVTDHGYVCKEIAGQKIRLFGQVDGGTHPTTWKHVIPLTRTNIYTTGQDRPLTSLTEFNDPQYHKNPFCPPWSHPDTQLYYTNQWPTQANLGDSVVFTPLEYLYQECRYNPDKDTGLGNIIYFKSNTHHTTDTIYTPPEDENLILKDYPLWMAFWAWTDWLLAAKKIQDHFDSYFMVVITKFIYPPKKAYIFLDKYFLNDHDRDLSESDRLRWHPKYGMQTEVEYFFATTGPFAPKITRSSSIQANMGYTFYFKWGGCPAPMEHVTSPCDQDKFPIPNPELQSLKIQDPKTEKEKYLYKWDERRGQLTETCAKRIKKDSTSELSVTGLSAFNVPILSSQEESDQETTEEEDETPLQQQLRQLRKQQRKLRHQLHRLTKKQKLEL
nr:MAG: ORF1 [TTV-like mini virus]